MWGINYNKKKVSMSGVYVNNTGAWSGVGEKDEFSSLTKWRCVMINDLKKPPDVKRLCEYRNTLSVSRRQSEVGDVWGD